MLTIHSKGLDFSVSSDGSRACFLADGVIPYEGADFWRLILDDGMRTEIPVFSHEQSGTVMQNGDSLTIDYPMLRTGYGDSVQVRFTVTVRAEGDLLSFTTRIENHAALRVNECFCPLADFTSLGGEKEKDKLYLPRGLGTCAKNPWKVLSGLTTRYYFHNEHETFWHLHYPRASMGWFGVQSAGRFLYVSRYDEEARHCFLTVRQRIHSNPSDLMVGVDHFPMARRGETVEYPPVVIGMLEGDWRAGAKKYREWADRSFFRLPEKAPWVREMTGWQRIIMRSQYGEDYVTADDLPELYRIGAKYGIHTLFLFAWWKEGMDRGYPVYEEPYPGAFRKLKEGIERVRALGGRVILECNCHFMDPKTDYYRENGAELAILDINGNEVRPAFVYPGYGEYRVTYGAVQFPLCCFGTEKWRNQVLSQIRQLDELGADCTFADCIGGCPYQPCFNDQHEHGNRVDREWYYRRQFFAEAEDYCKKHGKVLAAEVVTDVAASYNQFMHGLVNVDFSIRGDSFPAMFRYTFPEVITTERGIRDEEGDFARRLRCALVYGLRLDAELYVCRAHLDAAPKYAAAVKAYTNTLIEYREFFLDGTFTATSDLELPGFVRRGEYLSADGKRLLTVTYNPLDTSVDLGDYCLAPDEMRFDIRKI